MSATYDAIQTVTVANTTTTAVNFTSISQAYTDLILVGNTSMQGATDDQVPSIRVGNGTIDTGNNYSNTIAGYIAGAGAASFRDSNASLMRFGRLGQNSTQPVGIFIAHFQNYSNTTTNKTIIARAGNESRSAIMGAGLWRSTAAINAIRILEYSGHPISINSTFTLYGIKAE